MQFAKMTMTLTTDKSLYHVPDNGATVPYMAFEPQVIRLCNPSTTTSGLFNLFDTDVSNSAITSSGAPLFSHMLGPGENAVFKGSELVGLRFFYDVNVVCLLASVNVQISGALY